MRVTVKCEHSGLREVDVESDPRATAVEVGQLVREVILACPACASRMEAFTPPSLRPQAPWPETPPYSTGWVES